MNVQCPDFGVELGIRIYDREKFPEDARFMIEYDVPRPTAVPNLSNYVHIIVVCDKEDLGQFLSRAVVKVVKGRAAAVAWEKQQLEKKLLKRMVRRIAKFVKKG